MSLWRDLRLAARGLWRSPTFTAAVVLTLAIGTGALPLAGAAVGSAVSFSAARVLWAMIPGFGQIEVSTVALVSMALVTMAAVASWLPALTATKVDPVVALRYE